MENILKSLEKWRSDRNMDKQKDKVIVIGQILEEMSEFMLSKDEHEMIDSLADTVVFVSNHLADNVVIDLVTIRPEIKQDMSFELLPKTDVYLQMFSKPEYIIQTSLVLSIATIEALGYDYIKVLEEVIKEINSREQDPQQKLEWDKNGASGKWQKNKDQDPATLYKADFSKCKSNQQG